jgi:hypothetical protein
MPYAVAAGSYFLSLFLICILLVSCGHDNLSRRNHHLRVVIELPSLGGRWLWLLFLLQAARDQLRRGYLGVQGLLGLIYQVHDLQLLLLEGLLCLKVLQVSLSVLLESFLKEWLLFIGSEGYPGLCLLF